MGEAVLISVLISWAAFATLKWWKVADRLRVLKAWLAEEQRAEQDLLDLDPELAADIGIRRRIDEKIIEYRTPPMTQTQMNQNLALQQALAQQAFLGQQSGRFPNNEPAGPGNLLGGIGGGLL